MQGIAVHQTRKFLLGVQQLYAAAVEYIKAKFPLSKEFLVHVKFVNFDRRGDSQFSDIEYFMRHYERAIVFDATVMDEVFDKFVVCQLFTKEDIPQSVWESAIEKLEEESSEDLVFVRIDIVWDYLSTVKTGNSYNPEISSPVKTCKVGFDFHTFQSREEHVFHMVKQTKPLIIQA